MRHLTHYNLDFSEDVLHYADLGFKQVSMEPVVAQPEDDYAIREEDIPKICEEYDNWRKEMIKREKEGRGQFLPFHDRSFRRPPASTSGFPAGSGTEYLAVTPWGDFIPAISSSETRISFWSNVDTGIVHAEIQDEFKCCNVYAKEKKCQKCFCQILLRRRLCC